VLYQLLKQAVGVFFNILNLLMARNLPPLGCACVVVEEKHRYLVIEQAHGTYTFPGGFMRWHEHPTQTAKREGKEETGLDLRIGNMIGYQAISSNRIDRMSTLSIIFQAQVVGGTLRSSIEGRPDWLHENEVRHKLLPFYQSIFDDYQRYRTQSD